MITIVDYGMGNLRSVRRAFEQFGAAVELTSNPETVANAEALVLPGVGAFGEAVNSIDSLKLREPLLRHVAENKPLLGICLGMQLLFEASEENPGAKGLSILPGEVKKFSNLLKVPHIGWNEVVPSTGSILFGEQGTAHCFYFVHSYFVQSQKYEVAKTEYGIRFSSAVQRGNTMGTQFHPEKSQDAGIALLKRFAIAAENQFDSDGRRNVSWKLYRQLT